MTNKEAFDLAMALIDLRDSVQVGSGGANRGNCGSDAGVFIQRIVYRFPKVLDAMCEIEILRSQQ